MRRAKKINSGIIREAVSYIYLSVLSVIAIFPLLWIFISSIKERGEQVANPTSFLPKSFTLNNYIIVFRDMRFGVNIANSFMIAFITTVIAISISCLGAYGIVRYMPRLGKVITKILITTYMFPAILLAVPFSIIIGKVGLVNNRLGLIIVYMTFSVPYAVWLLVGFFKTVPLEIEEAAFIDGASKLQTFFTVVMPIVSPGVVAVAIYTFINAWNEFLYSLILINSTSKMTAAVALKSLEAQEILDWGVMMASSAIVVIPSVIFFMIIQNKIAGGLAQGSVK